MYLNIGMYLCICVYICVCIYIYIYVYLCIYLYMYMYMCLCVCIHVSDTIGPANLGTIVVVARDVAAKRACPRCCRTGRAAACAHFAPRAVASPSACCIALCRGRCDTHGAVRFALRRSASLSPLLLAHSRSAPPGCKRPPRPTLARWAGRVHSTRLRSATERVRAHACMRARGRHTDATLRAAVALWFDDNAAAVARYGPIGDWDTRDVKSMRGLFATRADFDEDIGRWRVGGVEDMHGMFQDATSFNRPLDKWDVSSVKTMNWMFRHATKFNQPLDKWDVSSVEDMYGMFDGAASFNRPLERWDVSRMKNTKYMFFGAASFKQPATLKRFGLVLPSRMRTDTRPHAVRRHRQSHLHARTHCSAAIHARVQRDSRARTHTRAHALSTSTRCPRAQDRRRRARSLRQTWQRRHPRRGRARLRTRAHEAVDAAHALRRAAGHARQRCRVLTVLTEYPRTLAPLGTHTHTHCARVAGVGSPGADVGSLSACAPQRGAAPRTVARPTASAAETAAAAADAVQPLGAAAPGRTDRLAPASPTDSQTRVGDFARASSTIVRVTRPPALRTKASGLRSMASPRCRRTGRLCYFCCPRPPPSALVAPPGPEQPAQAAGASAGSRRPRHCQRKAGAARIRVPDLPGQCRGPPRAAARALSKARRPGTRRKAQTARGACGEGPPGDRRPRAAPDMAADRVFAQGVCLWGPAQTPGPAGCAPRLPSAVRTTATGGSCGLGCSRARPSGCERSRARLLRVRRAGRTPNSGVTRKTRGSSGCG
jgi:surface protein